MPKSINETRINQGAAALVDGIRRGMAAQKVDQAEAFAMATVAFVEIIGQERGPHGLVDFLRDLADEIEADNFKKLT